MKKPTVILTPLEPHDREQFILDNQEAFLYGATEEFGMRDDHFEEDGEIILRKTIEDSIDGEHTEVYRIVADGEKAGGVVIRTDGARGDLELSIKAQQRHRFCRVVRSGKAAPRGQGVGNRYAVF